MFRQDTFETSVLFNAVNQHEANVHADLNGGLRPPAKELAPGVQVSDSMLVGAGLKISVGDFMFKEPESCAVQVLACLSEDGELYALLRPYNRVRPMGSLSFVWA